MSAGSRRVALVADVHGNLPALEAVLADARERGAAAIWNAGDCVGYGAQPRECVAVLRDVCEFSVLGNYDKKVLAFPRRRAKWSRTKHPLKFRAFQYAWENLDPASRQWLAACPRRIFEARDGCGILLVHATVLGDDDSVGPDTSASYWRRCTGACEPAGEVDLVLAGHLHRPFERQGRPRFVFAGSVGRPEDGDPRAHYTLIKVSGSEIQVENRRVAYDVDRAAKALEKSGLPEAFAVMLRRGVDLTDAQALMEDEPAG